MKENAKKRLRLTHSVFFKTMAFVLCILMLGVTALSVLGIWGMFQAEVYITSEDDARQQAFYNYASGRVYTIINWYQRKTINDRIDDYLAHNNIDFIEIDCGSAEYEPYKYESRPASDCYTFTSTWAEDVRVYGENEAYGFYQIGNNYDTEKYPPESIFKITVGISRDIEICDELFWLDLLVTLVYALRFWIYAIGLGALIVAILCFIFLMCSAGRRRGVEGITPTVLTKIPFEIPTAALIFGSLLVLSGVVDWLYEDIELAIGVVIWAILTAVAGILWCMSLALRIKTGVLFRNTLIFMILHFIWRVLCFIGRCIRTFVRSLPMIWKAVLIVCAVCVIEFFAIALTWYNTGFYLFLWFVGKAIVLPVVIYLVITLNRLKRGAREIADGKIEYKVDTKYLVLDLKDHGDDLNRIGDGMNIAVEERLRSERMKTELITNVSHDIKTPLTSIINYSDLICREDCGNEKIKEYAAVLHNQSERMKRLIDDLVEASKASSGNIDIMLAECDARVMISQVSGEYYHRLSEAGLELVCSSPDDEIRIMADGRRLWRVLDNLMNNALKYALVGTRVYVSLEEIGGKAVFRFKNISREALAADGNELTERFVRGDASRNTEGNGLGLSIAKSLTELQGGELEITVDGDLFKASVSFPTVRK